jgi:hypothetical protein
MKDDSDSATAGGTGRPLTEAQIERVAMLASLKLRGTRAGLILNFCPGPGKRPAGWPLVDVSRGK